MGELSLRELFSNLCIEGMGEALATQSRAFGSEASVAAVFKSSVEMQTLSRTQTFLRRIYIKINEATLSVVVQMQCFEVGLWDEGACRALL